MLRVLIVDDELIVRVGFKTCLNWEELGYEVIGMAEDGKEALELVKTMRPDLIFTDIKMPEMDGLELIKIVRERYPHIKFVVLSCLNEIDYVRRAMKLGAEDYILKLTFKPEDLGSLLQALRKKIKQEQAASLQSSSKSSYFEKEQIYRKLILDTSLLPKQIEQLFQQLELPLLQKGCYYACCVVIDQKNGQLPMEKMKDGYILKFAIINILKEFFNQYQFAETVEIREGEYLTYFYGDSKNVSEELHTNFKRLNNTLKTHLNLTVSLGLGRPSQSFLDLRVQYCEAFQALERRFFDGKALFSEYKVKLHPYQKTDDSFEENLVNAVMDCNKTDIDQVIQEWVRECKKDVYVLPSTIRSYAVEIWVSLNRLSKEFELELPDSQGIPTDLLTADSLEKTAEILKTTTASLVSLLEEQRSIRKEILWVKQYVALHIDEPLRLEEAAEQCGISKAYFSRLFKKECGESYLNYVNRMKMEKAKEYIQLKNMKASEAAARVGILDDSYFSKLFRKYIGVNPSQMKDN